MSGRRSNIEIIADILRMGQASKTQIMYRVGMSYAQLQKYLDYLVGRGFLVRNAHKYPGGIYIVSQEGKLLLESIEKLEELLTFDSGDGLAQNIGDSLEAAKGNGSKAYQLKESGKAIPV